MLLKLLADERELVSESRGHTPSWLLGGRVSIIRGVSTTVWPVRHISDLYSPPGTGRLVQRTSEAVEDVSEGASGWGPPGSQNPDTPDKDAAGYEEEGGDSKALKLTLMEEVLLLGLKDREVCPPCAGQMVVCTLCSHRATPPSGMTASRQG